MKEPQRVLFVCLGNICRSPLAEGVFQHLVRQAGSADRYHIESAGTGAWHVGNLPDPRSRDVARRAGITLDSRARQVQPEDFHDFDHIVAMDRENLRNLQKLRGVHGGDANLFRLRDHDPEPGDGEVPDPYYGGPGGFDDVLQMVWRACTQLLADLEDGGADEAPPTP